MDYKDTSLGQTVAFVGIVREIKEDGVISVVDESCPDSKIYRLFHARFLQPFGVNIPPILPIWPDWAYPPNLPQTTTEAIKGYREKFKAIMDGWDWESIKEVSEALHEEVDELSECLDPVISGQNIDPHKIAAELADIIIVAAAWMQQLPGKSDEPAMTLERIIQGRMDSNLDRAERAREAATLKNTEPKAEWETTKRLFEI